uniref:NAD(P)(+)--arginine ADP-ribosyltransferase n=1 Tax=Anas platyrhynchos TaxID=8839 RepID=A0A8B9QXJ9_ANAPL
LFVVAMAGILQAGAPNVRAITEKVMDMAWDSFDDQYQDCSREMEKELEKLYSTEFQNKVYADTWKNASKHWQSQWGNSNNQQVLPQEQAVAVLAYTDIGNLSKQLNDAMLEGGRSRDYYLQSFPFKTLHFLLTEALHTLQKTQSPKCNRVYRGVNGTRFTAQLNHAVRFGHFASASSQENEARKFGNDTFFIVDTCYGVSIKNFSFRPKQEEVLIPPYEVFKVTKVTSNSRTSTIHLKSQGMCSTNNCTLVKGKGRWGARIQTKSSLRIPARAGGPGAPGAPQRGCVRQSRADALGLGKESPQQPPDLGVGRVRAPRSAASQGPARAGLGAAPGRGV